MDVSKAFDMVIEKITDVNKAFDPANPVRRRNLKHHEQK